MTERTVEAIPIRPLHDQTIVEPIYDPDRLGSIYIPQEAKNPQSQQGIVVAAGKSAPYPLYTHILFEPYNGTPITYEDHEFLVIKERSIIGEYKDGTIFPRTDSVIIAPDFGASGPTRRGSIILLTRVFENPPIQTGVIVRVGKDVPTNYPQFRAGVQVLLPPTQGHEVGLDVPDFKGVYYFLPASAILGTLP